MHMNHGLNCSCIDSASFIIARLGGCILGHEFKAWFMKTRAKVGIGQRGFWTNIKDHDALKVLGTLIMGWLVEEVGYELRLEFS